MAKLQTSDLTTVNTDKESKLYNEAVSLTGYGKYNLYILLATGGCLMCVIVETQCMSFIIPAAQCDLELTLTQKGFLVSISFLGVFAASYFWGFMADLRGRKKTLVFSLISSSCFSLVCSVVPWAWLFILLRFINGALIGGASSIVYAYAGEFHDDRYRPMVINWVSSFVAVGQSYIPGMAWALLPQDWSYYIDVLGISFKPWRLLMIVYALPSLIVATMLAALPESPKFLLAQGHHDKALEILTKMFVINTGRKSYEYPVSTIILDEAKIEQDSKKPSMIKHILKQTAFLFKKDYIVKTVLCCYLQFGVFLSSSALLLWFPDILNNLSRYAQKVTNARVTLCGSIQDETVEENVRKYWGDYFGEGIESIFRNESISIAGPEEAVCDDSVDTGVFLIILLIGVSIGITYIILGMIINRIGKKSLLVGASAVTAICGLVAQYINGYETVLVMCGIFLLIASMVGVVNALAVDLFPTHVRAMAIAISLMFGRLGAAVGSNIVGVLFYSYCQYIFVFFAINHLFLIIAAILLPTKKPKTAASE